MTDNAPTPLRWEHLGDLRVGLWGLGTEGMASLARLDVLGVSPVVVVDDRSDAGAAVGVDTRTPADGGLATLADCDVVVISPGVSRHRPDVQSLIAGGVRVVGGLSLWLAGCEPTSVVAITGTKGKSTTTAIAAHLATRLGTPALAVGNVGTPPWDPALDSGPATDLWVVEASSYQVASLELSPPVVGVTALAPDHIPWHGDVETYYRDKLALCTRVGARHTVASGVCPELRARADQLGPDVEWVSLDAATRVWTQGLGLRGDHNLIDAAIARRLLVAAGVTGADDDEAIADAARGFSGLASRLSTIATRGGVEFVDDGLSTNVLPTCAALATFADRPVAVILGGADRQLDYGELADAIAQRTQPTLALTAYTTGPAIAAAIRTGVAAMTSEGTNLVDLVECADLAEAVSRAGAWATPGSIVLLSPAAPSFDAFDDYRERSAAFARLVASLPLD